MKELYINYSNMWEPWINGVPVDFCFLEETKLVYFTFLEGQFIILHRYGCACYICVEI